jgi:hypothetical protein
MYCIVLYIERDEFHSSRVIPLHPISLLLAVSSVWSFRLESENPNSLSLTCSASSHWFQTQPHIPISTFNATNIKQTKLSRSLTLLFLLPFPSLFYPHTVHLSPPSNNSTYYDISENSNGASKWTPENRNPVPHKISQRAKHPPFGEQNKRLAPVSSPLA